MLEVINMLSKHNPIQRDQIEMIALDELVPADFKSKKTPDKYDFHRLCRQSDLTYVEVRVFSSYPICLVNPHRIKSSIRCSSFPAAFPVKVDRRLNNRLACITKIRIGG